MLIIRPVAITDSSLTSTSVAETDYPEYDSGTTYVQFARVISTTTHRVYESAQAGNTGHALTDEAWWLDVSATNRWRMFDQSLSIPTEDDDEIVIVLEPGMVDSVALLNIDAATYRIEVQADGDTVYDTGVVSLGLNKNILDWYEYFFEPVTDRKPDVVITDLPPHVDGVITITLSSPTATVRIGEVCVGNYREIGDTQVRPRASIKDYSIKSTDDFGNATIVERAYSKRLSAEVAILNGLIDEVHRLLSKYRATALVWVGAAEYSSTIIYGYFTRFEFVIEHTEAPPKSIYALDIEGLT